MLLSLFDNWKNKLPLFKNCNSLSPEQQKFYSNLKSLLGIKPGEIITYQRAFRHKSLANKTTENNERLEFLGDAILSAVVTDYLYRLYPTKKEGTLSKWRSQIQSREQLNKLAQHMQLDKFLLVGQSLEQQGDSPPENLYGNALEALIGAVYVDKGYEQTYQFVVNTILKQIDFKKITSGHFNYKGRLLEWGQQEDKSVSFYVKDKTKIVNKTFFKVIVCIEEQEKGTGMGFTKSEAEQEAAKNACVNLSVKMA